MLAWAIGCTSAAVAGVLVAPTVGLSHVNLTLMIVNAYAAAMIGRLRSLPMTFVGAVLVGLLDAYALAYLPTDSVLLAQFRFAIPVILLFVVLLALPQSRLRGHSTRTTRETIPRPPWLGSLATAGLFVAAGVVAAQITSGPDAVGLQKIVAVAIIGLSLVPLVGFAGQLSLCQMSFAGIGAVLMAHHGQGGSVTGPRGGDRGHRGDRRAGRPAHAADGRHLPGAGHRGVRHAARPVDLRSRRLRGRFDADQHLRHRLGGRRPARRAGRDDAAGRCSCSSASCSRCCTWRWWPCGAARSASGCWR